MVSGVMPSVEVVSIRLISSPVIASTMTICPVGLVM